MVVKKYPIKFAWDEESTKLESFVTFNPVGKEFGMVISELGQTFSGLCYMRVVSNFSGRLYTVDNDARRRDNGFHLSAFFASDYWGMFKRGKGKAEVYERFVGGNGQHTFKARLHPRGSKHAFSFEFSFGRVEEDACKSLHSKMRKAKAEICELAYKLAYLEPERLDPHYKGMIEATEGLLQDKTAELEELKQKDLEERRLALAMAFHSRLGAQSVFCGLDPNIIAGLVAPHL